MNSLEERARAAVQATAAEIGPDDVPPPLRLPGALACPASRRDPDARPLPGEATAPRGRGARIPAEPCRRAAS
ncbi:MAG TPA: hypothetical protein VKG80_19425 [Trebonia sp.]|nr:hypothetical protein [Trebonia sp.]